MSGAGASLSPVWYDADSGTTLFTILQRPISFLEYVGRASAKHDILDKGGGNIWSSIPPDGRVGVAVDRDAADELGTQCDDGCWPRSVTLDIAYYQVRSTTAPHYTLKPVNATVTPL